MSIGRSPRGFPTFLSSYRCRPQSALAATLPRDNSGHWQETAARATEADTVRPVHLVGSAQRAGQAGTA
ncbi:hypothetical protein ACFV80_44110 [Streptomyces sp. NPDC059862]|uniref:hypothetical protein n=1 Tax=Streptomyces sp. NPDC059862 TaxID=3346975 RepID=UPI003657FC59